MGKLILGFILLAAGVFVGWYYLGGKMDYQSPSSTNQQQQIHPSQAAEETNMQTASGAGQATEKGGGAPRTVVTYSDSGFSPNPITVKQGDIVTFVNESSRAMWVATGIYPTDELLPSFNQKTSVNKGGMYEYTFAKVGTWQYQNQTNPTDIAKVIVIK